MTAAWILETLARYDVSLRAVGDRLEVDDPRGALRPLDWRILEESKPALLQLLSELPHHG